MTPEEASERIGFIDQRQSLFMQAVSRAELYLYELVLTYWELRDRPVRMLQKLWVAYLLGSWRPMFNQFNTDIDFILDVNENYFRDATDKKNLQRVAKTANELILERLGIDTKGNLIKDGYLDSVYHDESVKRQLQQFLYRIKGLKNDFQLKIEAGELIKGAKESGGIVDRFMRGYVYDTYQEADRMIQNEYAEKLGMTAAIYTGGLIKDSRPFCIERNSKVFLREEIELFGTPDDKFGGYSNKSQGEFSGKPKAGYNPILQCGGHNCRHHYSWLADEFAIMRDNTLYTNEKGELKRR